MNTYGKLIAVLQYVVETEHHHFIETYCKDDSCEAIEDAFADDAINHIYKTAKLALFDMQDQGGVA